MHFKSSLLVILLLVITYAFLYQINKTPETLIPRQTLFGNPDKTSVSLSPNAKYISYIAPSNGVLNIWLAPRDNIESAKPITSDNTRGIRNYTWAYDNEHILYLLDNNGDENFRVYSKNIKSNVTTLLTPEKGVRAYVAQVSYKFPNEVMISTNERDSKFFDIYKYNLENGSKELVFENNQYDQVIIDDDLQIRFVTLINNNGNTEYFKFEDNKFKPYMEVSLEDSGNTNIYGFDKTGMILYLADSRGRDTAALKAIDLKTGKSTIIAEDSKSDVDIFTSHPTENKIQAISTNYEKAKYTILDDAIKADMDYIATLGDGEIIINSRSLDDKYWIVVILSDNGPNKYYQYDRENKKAKFMFTNNKELEQYKLAKMHPVIIKARDGLDLVSYITFPVNTKLNDKLQPQQPLPTVLYVHGGPWARDYWGYNATHQWLANRDYVVLSVNYRASSGFGKNFTNAGNREWGKKMQDDLTDSVEWLKANKIAITDKIAIMGGSYGGYAVLEGLTSTPDLFACGVDIVGPSNLVTLLENIPPYWAPFINQAKQKIGPWDTEEEKQALLQISPLTFADRIKKPLLIAQGAHDPRVKQQESDQIVKVMREKNIPVLYALYEDEGHGFVRPENKISFYALTEQFFAKILDGKAEPIDKDLYGAKLILNGAVPKNSMEAEKSVDLAVGR